MTIIMQSRGLSRYHQRQFGFTMVDVMAATVVVALALAGVFVANTRAMGLVRSAKQAAVASKCLQQRIEQIRNYSWLQLTDFTAMQNLYSVPPLPSVELPGFSERVTVSKYIPAVPPATRYC